MAWSRSPPTSLTWLCRSMKPAVTTWPDTSTPRTGRSQAAGRSRRPRSARAAMATSRTRPGRTRGRSPGRRAVPGPIRSPVPPRSSVPSWLLAWPGPGPARAAAAAHAGGGRQRRDARRRDDSGGRADGKRRNATARGERTETVAGVVLVAHGGQSSSTEPTNPLQPAVLRMIPVAAAVRHALRGSGAVVLRPRFQVRGWNGAQASPVGRPARDCWTASRPPTAPSRSC